MKLQVVVDEMYTLHPRLSEPRSTACDSAVQLVFDWPKWMSKAVFIRLMSLGIGFVTGCLLLKTLCVQVILFSGVNHDKYGIIPGL